MSYAQVEASMATVLSGVTGLSAQTVTKNDQSILDRGVTACAIIEPGGVAIEPLQGRLSSQTWSVTVTIYVRYTTAADTHTAMVTLYDNVISRLTNYFPDIANAKRQNPYGFYVQGIAAPGGPQDIVMQNNPQTGPVFRAQTISVNVKQVVSI